MNNVCKLFILSLILSLMVSCSSSSEKPSKPTINLSGTPTDYSDKTVRATTAEEKDILLKVGAMSIYRGNESN